MKTVRWSGVAADYDRDELAVMAEMRAAGDVQALWLLHQLKAAFPGSRLRPSDDPEWGGVYVPAEAAAFDERRNTSRVFPVSPDAIRDAAENRYTPPELVEQPTLFAGFA